MGAAAAIGRGGQAEEARTRSSRLRKPLHGVLAAEDGRREDEVRGRREIERPRRAALATAHGLDEAVEGAMGSRGSVDDGEASR